MPYRREQVVEEARSWAGTPYVLRGAVKGAAIDCGMLPYCVLRKFELIPEFDGEYLLDGWWIGQTKERYLIMIERYLRKLLETHAYLGCPVPQAYAGNLVLAKVAGSRVYNHAGIITSWPLVVQAAPPVAHETNVCSDPVWAGSELVLFDIGLPV